MTRIKKQLLLILCLTGISLQASAHGRFILPTHTMLSAEEQAKVTILSSISNAIFHPDMPFANNEKGIKVNPKLTKVFSMLNPFVIQPNGSQAPMSYQAFNRLSVADLSLTQKGTYGVLIEQKPLIVTTYKDSQGEPGRLFGRADVPAGSTDVARRKINMRSASYISFNGLSDVAVQGTGLELAGQHPNDLFTGETLEFQLLLNGKGAPIGTEITLIREDTRHRNQREIQTLVTLENGKFSVTFEQAGYYLLETQVSKPSQQSGIDTEQDTLYQTLEVFAQ